MRQHLQGVRHVIVSVTAVLRTYASGEAVTSIVRNRHYYHCSVEAFVMDIIGTT